MTGKKRMEYCARGENKKCQRLSGLPTEREYEPFEFFYPLKRSECVGLKKEDYTSLNSTTASSQSMNPLWLKSNTLTGSFTAIHCIWVNMSTTLLKSLRLLGFRSSSKRQSPSGPVGGLVMCRYQESYKGHKIPGKCLAIISDNSALTSITFLYILCIQH
jgi:hypothetical protein